MATARIFRPQLRYVCRACTAQLRTQLRGRLFSSSASAGKPDIYDVVCVGGGPAGLSLLAALRASPAASNLRVALVEAQDLARTRSWKLPTDKFSNRCSSLTPSSAHFLNDIGAWTHMDRSRIQAYHEMQVWDGVTGARVEFDWPPGSTTGDRTVAYMNENLNLTSGLLRRLDELGGVSTFDNNGVDAIAYGEETEEVDLREWPVVSLAGGQKLWARLLVGADGANSPVRTFAGIESRGWDYGRHGVVATLQLDGDGWAGEHHQIAYQRFLPTGPVAMLPLPGNFATLVWSTTPSNAALLKNLAPADFIAMVNAAFKLSPVDLAYMHSMPSDQASELAWRAEHTHVDPESIPRPVVAVQEGTVASFPLKLRHADSYVADRIALIGDAAHTIHPLAGQGLNQGLGDVQSLVKAIAYAVEHGQDLGSLMFLEAYNQERYLANHILLGVCDKLHKLYSVESGPLVQLRSLGLKAVDALGPLKTFFMEQAAGRGIKI